jgi:hypothetical protein
MRRTLLPTVASSSEDDKLQTTCRLRPTAEVLAIADYRIICAVRGEEGDLQGVGYTGNGNAVMYDDIWTVEQARQAIADGHRLYTLSPAGGYAEVQLSDDGIEAKSDHSAGDKLDELPPCG